MHAAHAAHVPGPCRHQKHSRYRTVRTTWPPGISILNLFVSAKGSNGKGYPDLFWSFGGEGREVCLPAPQATRLPRWTIPLLFQMTENERLTLGVYDATTCFRLTTNWLFSPFGHAGDDTYRQNKLSSGDVVASQISIERKRRPITPTISLYVTTAQNAGVSGYKIWGKVTDNSSLVQTKLFPAPTRRYAPECPPQKIAVPADARFAGFIPAWEYPRPMPR